MKQYTYSFYKENQKWYIDFPAYMEHGGAKADLQMVAGLAMQRYPDCDGQPSRRNLYSGGLILRDVIPLMMIAKLHSHHRFGYN
jgi:hypothetical protein